MPSFRVKWEIDVEAGNTTEAALRALVIQRDPESTATVFDVRASHAKSVRVDLTDVT